MKEKIKGNWYKKSGYYYVRVTYYVGGERKCKNFRTGIRVNAAKEKKLDREADKKVAEVLAGFMIPGEKQERKEQLFADLVKEWLEHQKASKPSSTYAGYQYAADDVMLYFKEICAVKTIDLTSNMIEKYYNWERMRRQPGYTGEHKRKSKYKDGSGIESTIDHRITVIKSVLQYAKEDGIVSRNVASPRESNISLPVPQKNTFHVLTLNDAKEMIRGLEHEPLWFQVACYMGLLIGLRRSEIIGTREYAIDWERVSIAITQAVTQQTVDGKNTVTVKPCTKNKTPKHLPLIAPLNELVEALIKEHRNNQVLFGENYDHDWDGYLIRYPDGKLVSPNTLSNKFAQFVKKNKLKPIRFHDLRHSCASILYANDVDLMTIQQILGHAQLSTTLMYTHVINDQQYNALSQMSEQITGNSNEEEGE